MTFNGSLTGNGHNLTINSPNTTFGDALTDRVTGLGTLTTDAAGTTTINTDAISGVILTFHDALVLGASTVLTGATSVTFNGTLTGNGHNLTINSPNTTFGDAAVDQVTGLGTLTTDAAGTTTINTDTVSGAILTFHDKVAIGTSMTLTATSLLIFNQTVDGPHDLTLEVSGPTTFVGEVGSTTALGDGTGAAITIDSVGTTEFQSTLKTDSGITQANGSGTITFRGDITIAAGNTNTTFNANVVLDGLSFTSAGSIIFGNTTTDSLTISGSPTTITTAVANKDVTINSVTSLNADLAMYVGSASITHNGTVDGNNDLALNTLIGGLTFLNADLGSSTPLASLAVITGGPFTITHNITTNGDIQITVLETAGADDDLTVQNGANVQSNAGTISGEIGDDLTIEDGSVVQAKPSTSPSGTGQAVTFTVDPVSGDPDAFGATVIFAGFVIGSTVDVTTGDDADTFHMQRTAAPTTLNSGLSNDTINIASDAPTNSGTQDQIAGTLTVNGDDGVDTLNISDLGDATGDESGILTGAQLTGLGAAPITYATIENLNIDLGTGNDTFTFQSTCAITTTVLDANGGADTVDVQTTATGSVTTVNGDEGDDIFNVGNTANSLDDILGLMFVNGNDPAASDVLNINDQADADDNSYTLTPTTLNRMGIAELTYATIEAIHLNSGTGNDNIVIEDTHAGTTTVNANSGMDTLTLQTTSGTTTLNGDADNDLITVMTTGTDQATTVNGGIGQDTLNVQATGQGAVTTLNGGENADRINVQTIAGSTTVNGGDGDDYINVSSDAPVNRGTLNNISAKLYVFGDGDADILNVSDIGDPTNNAGDLTNSQLRGFGMGSSLTYGSLEHLNIRLGAGSDLIEIYSTHTPSTTDVDAGPGNDTHLIYENWGNVVVTERPGNGDDTLDFTPVSMNVLFIIGTSVHISEGSNVVFHPYNVVEHLIGGIGDDWFTMAGKTPMLAGGRGTIVGGEGNDTISYEYYLLENGAHRLFNGLGLAKPADVENVVLPPIPDPEDDVLLELLTFFGGDKPLDELIDLAKDDPGTFRPGSNSAVSLHIGLPTSILTPANILFVLSGGIGGLVRFSDVSESEMNIGQQILEGGTYIGQNGQIRSFGSEALCIAGVSIEVSNGGGSLTGLPSGETIALIFQAPSALMGKDLAIMWWDEARGKWREIDFIITPEGRYVAVTNLTGTFVLVSN